ncbi:hypothetical protein KA107_02050 [Candidatus Pacearchaeota archaeon]|nr:hypothetical protein [Candidatus Pacearchaeota archaeon]
MANPRYLTREGEPTVELLQKLARAKEVYFGNLDGFCAKWFVEKDLLSNIHQVHLVGSHSSISDWHNDTSDIDFCLVNPNSLPQDLFRYKRDILNPILCPQDQEKRRWIDLYFVRELYQILPRGIDLTSYWNNI